MLHLPTVLATVTYSFSVDLVFFWILGHCKRKESCLDVARRKKNDKLLQPEETACWFDEINKTTLWLMVLL